MFWTVTMSLLAGLGTAAKLFALTLLFALPLGLVIAFGSMSKWAPFSRLAKSSPGLAAFRPISALTNIIVWIIRGTPLMLQLIIIYYGPGLWFGQNIWGAKRLLACTVAFVINYACYFSEIYRGGIQSIPRGQTEAAAVLGMKKSQAFFYVTLPQVVKRIMPPMSNEIITLVKDTSLARVIGVVELIKFSEQIVNNYVVLWPLFYAGVFYLVFSGLLTLLFRYIEKKLDYYHD